MDWRDNAQTWRPVHGGYAGTVRADRFPGLAVEDGRAREWVARAVDDGAADESYAVLMSTLYPNGTDRQ